MGDLNPTFGIDNYNRPKVLTTLESYVTDVLMLLFGKPGFFPSIPSIGMDIQQYLYKFSDQIDTNYIKTELARQCDAFLPHIQTGDLDVIKTVFQGQNLLIFKLPIIDDNKQCSCAIGVTLNKNGDLIYNFVEEKNQIIH